MGDFFGTLYTMLGFDGIYGSGEGELADYLWGQASSVMTSNQFPIIGFLTILIAGIVAVLYYYGLGTFMQKPSWGNKLTWFIALAIVALGTFLLGWQWTLSDLYAGRMVTEDQVTGAQTDLPIDGFNCLAFGFVNLLIGVFWFVVLSFLIKWGSRDYSRIPV